MLQAGVRSARGNVPVGFPPELTPYSFLSGNGRSRILSYRRMPHQGNPRVWPRKLPCPLGQGGRSAAWVPGSQVSSHPGQVKRPPSEGDPLSARAGGVATPGSKTAAFHREGRLCRMLSGLVFCRRFGLAFEFSGMA